MADTTKHISKKIIRAYEKYAPKNLSLERFAQMVERDPKLLEDIGGEFSTFDLRLSRVYKSDAKTDPKNVRHTLKDAVDSGVLEQRALELAKIYEKIICSDDSIVLDAIDFDRLNEEEIQNLARKIIDGINKYFHIDTDLKVVYHDRYQGEGKTDIEQKTTKFLDKFLRLFKRKKINYSLNGQFFRSENKIVLYKKYYFASFISTLSHEYGHFIDENYPNLGALGSQIASYGYDVYASSDDDKKEYRVNPTEISSFKIGEIVSNHIYKVLLDQARKRQGPLHVKLAGLQLKYDKAYDKVSKLKGRIMIERGLTKLPWKVYKFLFDRLEKDKSLLELQELIKKRKEAEDKYYKLYWLVWRVDFMIKDDDRTQAENMASGNER